MLYIVDNLFISIYRTVKKTLKTDKDNINSLYIILKGDKELTSSHSVSCQYLSEFVTLIEKPR